MDDAEFQSRLAELIDLAATDESDFRRQYLQRIQEADIHTVDRLTSTLADSRADPRLRNDLCWLLGNFELEFTAPLLQPLMVNRAEPVEVRHSAVWVLNWMATHFRSVELQRVFRSLLRDADEEVRYAAANCLGWSGNWRYVPRLLKQFNDPSETPRVRGQLAEGLAYLGAKRAIPDLVRALSDESGEVRFWAIFALGTVADQSVIPALEKLSRDRTKVEGFWTVGKEARDAIRWIRDRQATTLSGE